MIPITEYTTPIYSTSHILCHKLYILYGGWVDVPFPQLTSHLATEVGNFSLHIPCC